MLIVTSDCLKAKQATQSPHVKSTYMHEYI